MVRWAPLTDYLRRQDREQVRLTYQEIEDILGGEAPTSATVHRPQMWSNGQGNAYSTHWRRAG